MVSQEEIHKLMNYWNARDTEMARQYGDPVITEVFANQLVIGGEDYDEPPGSPFSLFILRNQEGELRTDNPLIQFGHWLGYADSIRYVADGPVLTIKGRDSQDTLYIAEVGPHYVLDANAQKTIEWVMKMEADGTL